MKRNEFRSCGLLLAILLIILSLCACGKTSSAEVKVGASELYSEAEIMKAVDVVMDTFQRGYDDCTLLTVEYSEEYTLREQKDRSTETIVLLTDFYVGLNAMAVGPMYPGRTCSNYQWILTRNGMGGWTLQDRGYG